MKFNNSKSLIFYGVVIVIRVLLLGKFFVLGGVFFILVPTISNFN